MLASLTFAVSCGVRNSAEQPITSATGNVQQLGRGPNVSSDSPNNSLGAYINNDLYIVIDADIDRDGILDKIVSSAPYHGDELIFFRNDGNNYYRVLVSRNLTEDGGRILGEIKPTYGAPDNNEIVAIETHFPKGMDVATHYISVSHSGNTWELSRTVYEISDWRHPNSVVHTCNVSQAIPMQELRSSEGMAKIHQLPDASTRDDVCNSSALEPRRRR